jgi:hypothetical protein
MDTELEQSAPGLNACNIQNAAPIDTGMAYDIFMVKHCLLLVL